MTRILYIINNLDVGGAERHLQQVLPGLLGQGFEPSVFTIGYKGKLAPEFEASGIPVSSPFFVDALKKLPRPLGVPLLMISASFRLLLILWTLRPRIVHFFLPHAYILGATVSLFKPGLVRIMSRRSLNNYQRIYPIAAKVERRLHSFMDAVLGNSKKVVEQLRAEGIADDRLGLIYNGIDLMPFEQAQPASETRHAIGVAQDGFVMTAVANLIPYKGHQDLLEALGMIKDKLPINWRMLCVGRDTGIGPELQQRSSELGISENVLWLGERTDTVDLLAASDLGLLVSHEEGFSNSVLEGMASGLSMVVTDVGGNSESVVHDKTGIVVPAKCPHKLAEAILLLASNSERRAQMGKAGKKRVYDRFSLDKCVATYCEKYRSYV